MGIAGSTLGGGPGWLMAKHGLAADNLMSALLVTAEGDVLCADASSHPDLFWALRGGGGNFGIVTSLTYRLHPIEMVVGGVIAHPVDAASQLLRFYREAIADASDDLTVLAALMHAPDGSGRKLAAFVVFHAGDAVTADRELAPFKAWGSPLLVDVASIPYPVMNKILDASFPPDALGQCRSRLRRGLTDELIETAVQRFRLAPSQMSAILLEHRHGAVTRVAPTATAVPERQEGWNLLIPTVPGPANVAWARETFAALRPNLDSGRYGLNYARLQDVKRRYDPENVFRVGHNIAP
jgi:FAD/FMN-containing dehydrogenase